jgi:hypothetical protein
MEKHIIRNCSKVDHSIREAVLFIIEVREIRDISLFSAKHQIGNDQTNLEDFYENSDLSKK